MGGVTSAGGTGTGARGTGWTGGIGGTGPDGAPGHGGIYISHSWGATCKWWSMTGGTSCVIGGGTWNVRRYSSLARVNLQVVDASRWSTMIRWGFGE